MNLWLSDPKTHNPSVTLTVFVMGMVVATVKLLLSGVSVNGVVLNQFTGGDFAAVVGSLGALYVARRHPSMTDKDNGQV